MSLLTLCGGLILTILNLHAFASDTCYTVATDEDIYGHTSLLQTSLTLAASAKDFSLAANGNTHSQGSSKRNQRRGHDEEQGRKSLLVTAGDTADEAVQKPRRMARRRDNDISDEVIAALYAAAVAAELTTLANASTNEKAFEGFYTDPNHPGGTRKITVDDGSIGAFRQAWIDGGGGEGEPASYTLPALVVGDRIICDFSVPPKSAPIDFAAFKGRLTEQGIEWEDGNVWPKAAGWSAIQRRSVAVRWQGESPLRQVSDVASAVSRIISRMAFNDSSLATMADQVSHVTDTFSNINDTASMANLVIGSAGGVAQVEPLAKSTFEINSAFWHIAIFVISITGVSYLLGLFVSSGSWGEDRPRPWALGLLISSYMLLIPGLTQTLLAFEISVKILGITFILTQSDTGEPGEIAESFFGYVDLLWKSGGYLAACLVILYAMIIPAFKLTFLLVGEICRYSPSKSTRAQARQCIFFVQVMSKWACPDMFVYILLLYLIRHVDGKAGISAPAQLDTGFACFAVFCILSTCSALTIKMPSMPVHAESAREPSSRIGQSLLLANWGYERSHLFTMPVAAAFFVTFGIGITQPCLAVRVDTDLIITAAPALLQPELKLLLPFLSIEDVDADVSICQCIMAMYGWVAEKQEVNCMLALVLFACFAVALTALNVVALVFATSSLQRQGRERVETGKASPNAAMKVANVLHHLSMMDVCVVGLLVVTAAAVVYRDAGMQLYLMQGVFFLMLSEVVRYALYYIVSSAVEESEAVTIRFN